MSDSDLTGAAIIEITCEDLPIECIDCRESFVWTAGEQAFYRSKGLTNPPKRCKPCKKAKNNRLDAIEHARATGQRYRVDINAECASCHKMTTIPFYPSQGRPVFCRACYLETSAQENSSGANAA